MKNVILTLISGLFVGTALCQSSIYTDPRGLPSGVEWVQKIDDRTSSTFRTYQAGKDGPVVSYNPQTSEVVRGTKGSFVAVIREDLIPGDNPWANIPVLTPAQERDQAKDSGIPASLSGKIKLVQNGESSAANRTYEIIGQPGTVTINPYTGELAQDANGQWKPVMREPEASSGDGTKSPQSPQTTAQSSVNSNSSPSQGSGLLTSSSQASNGAGTAARAASPPDDWSQVVPGGKSLKELESSLSPNKAKERKLIRTEYVPGSYGYISGGHTAGTTATYGTSPGYTIYYYSDGTTENR